MRNKVLTKMSNETSYIIDESKSKEDLEKIIEELKEKVDELFYFRDHYFENHSIDKAVSRDFDIKEQFENTLTYFDESKEKSISGVMKAQYLYLKGRVLNIASKYNPLAAQTLSKAVKLDPNLVEAWNELGECYWKDNNITEAKNCFTGALQHKRNKISLRNMSIMLRQGVYVTSIERQKNIEKSVDLAKEAVRLDLKDGMSWSLLGNAYLCSFFVIGQDPAILKSCKSAYKQAINDPVARGQADLHYNRAVALKYEEEFLEALKSYSTATSLDPTWTDPMTEKLILISYLDDINEYIKTKGKMKEKKLHQMIQQLDHKQLGPYSNGKYSVKNQSVKLELTQLNDLKEGINQEKLIFGKVVCSVRNENHVPFTFCFIDSNGSCVAVTLYNLADGKGVIIGDSIAIPEPFKTIQNFNYDNKEYQFNSIRIDNPMVMVVNGKKVGKNQIAGTKITCNKVKIT